MKKFLVGLVVALVVTAGVLYFTGFFDKREATAEEKAAADESVDDLRDAIDYENVEMPGLAEDTATVEIEIEEEFNAEDML